MAGLVADSVTAETVIVELTNAFRRENALAEVRRAPKLDAAARQYAEFLARSGLFSHEADGRRASDRIKAIGYEACASAENLASMERSSGFETRELAVRMVEGWKASPGHRKNLLMGLATETGVAVVKVKSAEKYVSVQVFGRPQSLEFSFKVENAGPRSVTYSFGGERVLVESGEVITHTTCAASDVAFDAGVLGPRSAPVQFGVRAGLVLRVVKKPDGALAVETRANGP